MRGFDIADLFNINLKLVLWWYLENLICRQHFSKIGNETSFFLFDQALIDGNEILSRRDWTWKQLHRIILWNWKKNFICKWRISIYPIHFHLVFKSLTHCIEDERVDSRVNVTHRVSNNLIKTNIWTKSVWITVFSIRKSERNCQDFFFHKFAHV